MRKIIAGCVCVFLFLILAGAQFTDQAQASKPVGELVGAALVGGTPSSASASSVLPARAQLDQLRPILDQGDGHAPIALDENNEEGEYWSFPMRMMAYQAAQARSLDEHMQVLAWGYAALQAGGPTRVHEEIEYLSENSLRYVQVRDDQLASWVALSMCPLVKCDRKRALEYLAANDSKNAVVGVWLMGNMDGFGQNKMEGLRILNSSTKALDALEVLAPHLILSQEMMAHIKNDPEGRHLLETLKPVNPKFYLSYLMANTMPGTPLQEVLDFCLPQSGLCVEGGKVLAKSGRSVNRGAGEFLWADHCRDITVCEQIQLAHSNMSSEETEILANDYRLSNTGGFDGGETFDSIGQ